MMRSGPSFVLLSCVLLLTAGCHKVPTHPGAKDVQKANDEVRDVIKKKVHDNDRRVQLEALVDTVSRQAAELGATSRREVEEMKSLNRDYDATRQDFENLAARFRQERKKMYQAITDSLLEMRSLTDHTAWKAIIKKEKKALVTRLSAGEG